MIEDNKVVNKDIEPNKRATAVSTVRRGGKDIELPTKWAVVDDYLNCKLSNQDIAEKYSLTLGSIESIVSSTYKKFQNIREMKALIATQKVPKRFSYLKKEYLDPTKINEEFLQLLSEDTSRVLTDQELIFCELFVATGNERRALEESGLAAGLKGGGTRDTGGYSDAIKLRSFYLRRKYNVADFIRQLQREQLHLIKNGREDIQTMLLSIMNKIENNGDPKYIPQLLQAVKMLGETNESFKQNIEVTTTSGDDALDAILAKAKSVNGPMAYSEGVEVYE